MTTLVNVDYTVETLKKAVAAFLPNDSSGLGMGIAKGDSENVRGGVDFTNAEEVPTRKIISEITPESLYSMLLWSMGIMEGLYSHAVLEKVLFDDNRTGAFDNHKPEAKPGIYVSFFFKAV